MTACSILLATSTHVFKDTAFFLSVAIFKSRLAKMAATVIVVEFAPLFSEGTF